MFTKKHTFSEKGFHFCEFCENCARFPWIDFLDFPNNSLNVHEKRTNSLKFYEQHTNSLNIQEKTHMFRKTCCLFCEFCENCARFPWVEFVDFRKIATAPRENQKIDSGVVQNQYQIKAKSPPHREKIKK